MSTHTARPHRPSGRGERRVEPSWLIDLLVLCALGFFVIVGETSDMTTVLAGWVVAGAYGVFAVHRHHVHRRRP